VFLHSVVPTATLEDAIERIAEDAVRHGIDGGTRYRVARELLLGRPPRLRGMPFTPLEGDPPRSPRPPAPRACGRVRAVHHPSGRGLGPFGIRGSRFSRHALGSAQRGVHGPLPDGHVRESHAAQDIPCLGAPRKIERDGRSRLGLRRAWSAAREALPLAVGATGSGMGRVGELYGDWFACGRRDRCRGARRVERAGDPGAEEGVRSRVVAPHQQGPR
jgi:hypothetical protein